jgi:2-polyprenyl-3-methyl-5-hydroxy-6-metoxy-1,4-benzoquinol methylase
LLKSPQWPNVCEINSLNRTSQPVLGAPFAQRATTLNRWIANQKQILPMKARYAERMVSDDGEGSRCAVYGDVENFEDAAVYFGRQMEESIPEFWARCGGQPDLCGMRVLEVGCGHGALCVDMARNGAIVVGVDLNRWRVSFATELLQSRYPQLTSRVQFSATPVQDLPRNEPFDYIVSKDTLEHIDDLDGLLESLYQLLKPGGFLIAGSTPLYWSPKGDHGRTGLRVPSLHALLPTSIVLAAATRHKGYPVRSLSDIGMNGYTPRQYREFFNHSKFEQVKIEYNQGKRAARVLGRLRPIPGLEKYVTTGFYLWFRRPSE